MKKILVILMALIGFSLNSIGQTASCKISGGQEGATVVASITEIGDGYVMVSVDNDGSFDVNVTIKITGPYSGTGTTSGKARRDQTTTIKVPMPTAESKHSISNYKITVSGARCN